MPKTTPKISYRFKTWFKNQKGPKPQIVSFEDLAGHLPGWASILMRAEFEHGRLIENLTWSAIGPSGPCTQRIELIPPDGVTVWELLEPNTEKTHGKI